MIVTIHQPEHLPWLGFLDKVRQAELFVSLDHVQFRKRYFQNRNRIRTAQGAQWLSVPVRVKGRFTQALSEVAIDGGSRPDWAADHWESIRHAYARAPHFAAWAPELEALYRRPWARLVELNEAMLRFLFKAFGLNPRWVRSSELGVFTQTRGELILEICRRVKASNYVSGISGRDYLDVQAFQREGIGLSFQEFHHPIYPQLHEPFMPLMSSLDLLFNHGPRAAEYLAGPGIKRMEEVFL